MKLNQAGGKEKCAITVEKVDTSTKIVRTK